MAKPKVDKNLKIPSEILEELLTPSEIRMLKNRWQILKLLEDGLSVRQVASQAKVGTDTVVRISRMMDKTRLKTILDETLRSAKRRLSGQAPWIFGKSE